ncbi:ABC transporter ATP-binding protein [Christensenellaceae bacterium OttesenSCG-928-L17]|nr:ABC transporter ATP-binding protein [Christensenellaceae bacterium OttesenSCG-928-L17]
MGSLTISNITKQFGATTAVNNVSLQVNNGELLTVVGPSGCGKTTLLRMIAGFIEPTRGKILLDERVLVDFEGGSRMLMPEERDVGMVFQSYAVWPHMNVFDNVGYPLKIRKTKKDVIREKVMETLRVVHLDGYENRMAHELSGGQQQRVALARSLVMRPELLLLDEPLSNLDAALREEMRGEIKEIQRTMGITIVNVTHDQIEAMTMSDKVAVMRLGNLIQFDSPYELYEHPVNTFVAKFIGSANIIPAIKEANAAPDEAGMMEVKACGVYALKVPYVNTPTTEGFLAVRAHHMHPDANSSLKTTVHRKLYQGNLTEYHLDLLEGTMIRMNIPVGYGAQIGEPVPIAIEKAVWLDE